MNNRFGRTAIFLGLLAGSLLPLAAAAATPADPAVRLGHEARIKFLRSSIDEIRGGARYPEWSEPVAMGAADPLLQKHMPSYGRNSDPYAATPTTMTVWCSENYAEAGQSVHVFAQIEALPSPDGRPLTALRSATGKLAARVRGQVSDDSGAVLGALAFADDGHGADAHPNDGVYSASWVMPTNRVIALGQSEGFTVMADAELPSDKVLRHADTRLSLSHPGGHLTGQFRDLIRDGNLVIEAEVDVRQRGRFYLVGTLATATGEPVANGQAAQSFTAPGKYWIGLSYYGLIFHERGALGRLRLSSVSLSNVDSIPGAPGQVLTNAFVTQPLNPAALRTQSYDDPDLLEIAKRMEATLSELQ